MTPRRPRTSRSDRRARGGSGRGSPLTDLALLLIALLVAILLASTLYQWTLAPKPQRRVPRGLIRVEVLNGCGAAGAASRVTERLRDQGIDVLYYGNAASFDQVKTVVIDRMGRPDLARWVAEELGCARVRTEIDRELMLDVTVVLGSDWEQMTGGGEGGGKGGMRGWVARAREWALAQWAKIHIFQ